ncbi:hypothetical protein DFS34DRAFT_211900 [Phlyctochytrium arcticum]|nr:hypothetical protein DFS34DRAFT_211900 [Phlyctochytrium arcticum]
MQLVSMLGIETIIFRRWAANVLRQAVRQGTIRQQPFQIQCRHESSGRASNSPILHQNQDDRSLAKSDSKHNDNNGTAEIPKSTGRRTSLFTQLRSAVKAPSARPQDVWDVFSEICSDEKMRQALPLSLADQAVTHMLFRSPAGSIDNDKLDFVEEQVTQMSWTDPRVLEVHENIRRGAQHFDIATARSILEEMEKDGLKPRKTTYLLLASAVGRNGDGVGASEIVSRMTAAGYQANGRAYHSIIYGYAKARRGEQAMNTFRVMQKAGILPSVESYTTLISAFTRQRKTKTASVILTEMVNAGIRPTSKTFNSLLDMFYGRKEFQSAEKLLSQMQQKGKRIGTDTYNIIMHNLAKSGRLTDATTIFENLKDFGVQPDSYTYAILIQAFARSGLMINALEYYHRLNTSGLKLEQIHLTIMLSAFVAAGDMETCQEVWRDLMLQFRPNVFDYTIMMDAWIKQGDISRAKALLEQMQMVGVKPDYHAYETLLKGWLSQSKIKEALTVFHKMRSATGFTLKQTYILFIPHLTYAGMMGQAVELVNEMMSLGFTPSAAVLEPVILGYLKSLDVKSGLRWLEALLAAGHRPSAHLYNALIRATTLVADPQRPFQFYQEMLKDDHQPTAMTYNHLLLASFHSSDHMDSILADMRKKQVSWDHYTFAVLIFIHSRWYQNFGRAWYLWKEYINLGEGLSKRKPSRRYAFISAQEPEGFKIHPVVAKSILRTCAAHRKLQYGFRVWQLIDEQKVDVKSEDVAKFMYMVDGWAQGSVPKGEKLLNLLESERVENGVYLKGS